MKKGAHFIYGIQLPSIQTLRSDSFQNNFIKPLSELIKIRIRGDFTNCAECALHTGAAMLGGAIGVPVINMLTFVLIPLLPHAF